MVQFMIRLIKYDKFNDISIRRILKRKKDEYAFERKTNSSTAALMSGKKKDLLKKN